MIRIDPVSFLSNYLSDVEFSDPKEAPAQPAAEKSGQDGVQAMSSADGWNWECTVQARVSGMGSSIEAGLTEPVLSAHAQHCGSDESAKQEAALRLLHKYEAWFQEVFQEGMHCFLSVLST